MLLDKATLKDDDKVPVEPEHPPPYSLEGTSSSAPQSRQPSVLPPLPAEAFLSPVASDSPSRSSPQREPSYSQIRLDSGHNDITGTYYIDPKSPPLLNKKSRKKDKLQDAIFRTRTGDINLDLATTGKALDVPKASVNVITKSGSITLNLLPVDETRPRLDLDVKSNSGIVVVYVPETYCGAIQLRTKRGHLRFMPAMLARSQVVKSSETEALVLFGKQALPQSRHPSDFCLATSRSGNIVIGLRGHDTYVESPGLWQRIGQFFTGDS
ncbi:hypothetical protein B0H15DRAFT_230653 [Mycena belliarum]|uniref:DUF7330 domain-containing protein n=1 Tax=Mycena belliarum TaxID=1033014 RepID=A0AAD6UAU6_9AGAR|nr:hypothetical protein B0H15DRAFT_230653 [Mycena belliae]